MAVYISFSAEISPQTTESLISVLGEQANKNVDEVCLMISTPGGSVTHGINLYNILRAMPFRVITHNVGNVDSIGNAIFLAGEERYAVPHSTFMFHGVGVGIEPGQRLGGKILQEKLDTVLRDQKRISAIIGERTKMNSEEIDDLFLESRTGDVNYALERGIIHEIREARIPPGGPVIPLVFQRQGPPAMDSRPGNSSGCDAGSSCRRGA